MPFQNSSDSKSMTPGESWHRCDNRHFSPNLWSLTPKYLISWSLCLLRYWLLIFIIVVTLWVHLSIVGLSHFGLPHTFVPWCPWLLTVEEELLLPLLLLGILVQLWFPDPFLLIRFDFFAPLGKGRLRRESSLMNNILHVPGSINCITKSGRLVIFNPTT